MHTKIAETVYWLTDNQYWCTSNQNWAPLSRAAGVWLEYQDGSYEYYTLDTDSIISSYMPLCKTECTPEDFTVVKLCAKRI